MAARHRTARLAFDRLAGGRKNGVLGNPFIAIQEEMVDNVSTFVYY